MNPKRSRLTSGVLHILLLVASASAAAQSALPLIQKSDITYLGAFALPGGMFGTSSFDYGGHALAPYRDGQGRNTLYLQGHAQRPGNIAQVLIPDQLSKSKVWEELPTAAVLQNFADITEGQLSKVDPGNAYNPINVYGLLPYNGRLIVGASSAYSSSQSVSHGVYESLTLSGSGKFKGWYRIDSAAPPRAVGGTMMLIPTEWQSAFGGRAFTGQFGLSVVSTTSSGPSLTVFDPDTVGKQSPIAGQTVLYYPLEHPACGSLGCEDDQSEVFNLASGYAGMAFPPGTRSVLFVTAQGTGRYCYDTAAACNDPAMPDVKGPHAPPYRYQILAYDANELVAVKEGRKRSWEPKPYGVFVLEGMANSGNAFSKGAAYDPVTQRLFITQDFGTGPRVEVYKINAPSGVSKTPGAPAGLTVQ